MDQPYSRLADMLLDTAYFNVNEPRPYDDTGWTLGALKNVKTVRVKDTAVLKGAMKLLTADARPKGSIQGSATVAYAIANAADNSLAVLRFKLPDVKMLAAEKGFDAGGRTFGRGSVIVPASADAGSKLAKACEELGVQAFGLDAMPATATHELVVPRVAILHTWTSTQNEGWYRLAFDTLGIPFSYISDQDVGRTSDLRARYDVIIFPPTGGAAQRLVNGIPVRGEPIPWKATEQYPNLTGPNGAQTDDTRGGMGLEGVNSLKRFVEEGGLFIAVESIASIPIDYGLVEGLSVQQPRQLQVRGSVLSAVIADKNSPVTYGYEDTLPLYFGGRTLFNLGGGLGGFAGMMGQAPAPEGRETGRGNSPRDPDVVQARPLFAPPAPQQREGEIPSEFREMAGALLPPEDTRPRVLLRWAPEKDLLISGMLAGGAELAGKPAVVDAPLGKGHILFFSNNPFWRMETSGSYMLVFNAAMNFNNLSPKGAEKPSN
jgi:hypothetical protein